MQQNDQFMSHAGQQGAALQEFTDMLLKVGDGTYPTEPSLEPNHIRIPPAMVSPANTLDDFITSIVGGSMIEHVPGHHILTPRNDDVDMLNGKATDMMPAEVRFLEPMLTIFLGHSSKHA